MTNWQLLVARLISMMLSWAQAGNLRTQIYILKEKNELMRTALEDIQRMDPEGQLGWIAKITLDKTDGNEQIH